MHCPSTISEKWIHAIFILKHDTYSLNPQIIYGTDLRLSEVLLFDNQSNYFESFVQKWNTTTPITQILKGSLHVFALLANPQTKTSAFPKENTQR